jgi:hypothetical protein
MAWLVGWSITVVPDSLGARYLKTQAPAVYSLFTVPAKYGVRSGIEDLRGQRSELTPRNGAA